MLNVDTKSLCYNFEFLDYYMCMMYSIFLQYLFQFLKGVVEYIDA